MKRILITAFAAVLSFGFMTAEAEAKRLGGGMSSGMKRDSTVMKRDPAPTQSTAPKQNSATPTQPGAPTPAPASGMSRWMGPIAGLAAGLGIAALFSHFGMGEGMANFFMLMLIVMAVIFVLRLLFRKREPQTAYQYAGAGNAPQYQQYHAPENVGGAAANAAIAPADFDAEGFVRQAKVNFVRMQAANDAGNMDDIRNFTSPEMFAEIQMQYQERGRSNQQTDVVQLDAGLLDVSEQGAYQVASVRFRGLIRESADANPESFEEVWHLTRPLDASSGWVVAGIQQS